MKRSSNFSNAALRNMLLLTLSYAALFSGAYAASAGPNAGKAFEGQVAIADLHVVDCLLPGQVRQLGRRTFLTPRRPIRTTAADCRLRGGEYVAWDRANYSTALKVWMSAAEGGDADAQTNVGEIFERGLGGEPNYAAALIWYRKAAKQGSARAQFNLGTMYEQGLGVAKSQLEALNWYRLAWGLSEDSVIFSSAARREQEALRNELQQQLSEKEQQLDVLTRRLRELDQQRTQSAEGRASAQAEMDTLKTLVASLQQQQTEQRTELAGLAPIEGPLTREPAPAPEKPIAAGGTEQWVKDVNLGRYYALLIANADYRQLENLSTPINDLRRARRILEEKYGFEVFVVENGDNIAIMKAINDVDEVLGENDNLLLFFAGHGTRLQVGRNDIGYWLPANAERPPRDTFWVPNEFVTGHLSRLKARHILVVADSCYAGLLSTEPSYLLIGDQIPQYSNLEFMRFKNSKRARLLLSSGGDRPVLDAKGDGHSVFARAFLDELEANDDVMAAPQLFLRLRDRVRVSAAEVEFEQRPEFKAIKTAGHEAGGFFFVPLSIR